MYFSFALKIAFGIAISSFALNTELVFLEALKK